MTRVHLIDGTYELFRAFFGAPAATAHGHEVGAGRGMLRSFAALLRSGTVTHGAVAYDHVIESFRNDLFAGYKTGAGIEPALWSQAGLAEDVAAALGLVVWPMIEFEADDALAAAAVRLADDPRVTQAIIASPDKDFCQVVRPKIVTWDRLRDRTFDEAGVRERLGVAPGSVPDLLALVGDDADGIPGLPRWGMKSAAAVLTRYPRLEDIPLDAPWDITVRGAAALIASLREHRDEAFLYRTLATLREDVPIDSSLETLQWRGPDHAALAALCDRLEIPPIVL